MRALEWTRACIEVMEHDGVLYVRSTSDKCCWSGIESRAVHWFPSSYVYGRHLYRINIQQSNPGDWTESKNTLRTGRP